MWRDEIVATLIASWLDGLSAAMCAQEIWEKHGVEFSRNAICGKIFRLGLATRQTTRSVPVQERQSRKGVDDINLRRRLPHRVEATPVQLINPHDPTSIPIDQRKTFAELENHHCRFPYGDPGTAGFFFCGVDGANLLDGRPYCAAHARIAYEKPKSKPFVPYGHIAGFASSGCFVLTNDILPSKEEEAA